MLLMPNTSTSATHTTAESSKQFGRQNNFSSRNNMGTSQPTVRHSLNVSEVDFKKNILPPLFVEKLSTTLTRERIN